MTTLPKVMSVSHKCLPASRSSKEEDANEYNYGLGKAKSSHARTESQDQRATSIRNRYAHRLSQAAAEQKMADAEAVFDQVQLDRATSDRLREAMMGEQKSFLDSFLN